MPLTGVFTMAAIFEQGLWAARLGAMLLGVFGALALVLAAVGVYGVMAYSVSQRTRGSACGWPRREHGNGSAPGAARAWCWPRRRGRRRRRRVGLNRLIVGLMCDVSPYDPVMLTAIPLLLLIVAVVAIYLPARRASRVDPVIALRVG